MSLTNYLRSAVLGAALAFSCGPKEGFDDEDNRQETLEVRVQRDVTDNNGIAFNGAQGIVVRDEGTPVANEEVTLYSVISEGDVYLTGANGGGIALFPDSRRRHGGSSGRELNVNEPQQLNSSREELLSGLLRWSLSDFSCVSAESVPANGVPRVIIYSDENGRQVAFGGDYSRVQFEQPAQFYSFDPVGEGVPLLIPDAIAREVFSESLYETIRKECRGSSSASCSGEVLFEDEFEGEELDEGMWDIAAQNDRLVLNNGVLEMYTSGGAGLQSRSTYSLSDGPLCFEARWRVREREGTNVFSALRGDKGTVGFIYDSDSNAILVGVGTPSGCEDGPKNTTNITEHHVYGFSGNQNAVDFLIDNEVVGTSKECLNEIGAMPIYLSCSSRDKQEKVCYFDYIKITR